MINILKWKVLKLSVLNLLSEMEYGYGLYCHNNDGLIKRMPYLFKFNIEILCVRLTIETVSGLVQITKLCEIVAGYYHRDLRMALRFL